MNTKYYVWLICALFSLGMTGCSEDDEAIDPRPMSPPELHFDKDKVVVLLDAGNETKIDITEGAGDYKAFSLNMDIATVSMSGNSLFVKGISNGETSIMVSDKENRFKAISVSVQYERIVLAELTVDLTYRLGRAKSVAIDILAGNGGYSIVSGDEEIATASVSDNTLTVTVPGKKAGETTITLKDKAGREAIVNAKATFTKEPYDEAELEAIISETSNTYVFDGEAASRWYSFLNTVKDGMFLYGWDFYDYEYLRIYLAGDKSVGDKPGSRFEHKSWEDELPLKDLDVCRIIKNDGTKIWCIYSYVHNEIQYSGYFIQDIKP